MTRKSGSPGGARQCQSVIFLILFVCAWGFLGQSHAAGACEPWIAKIVSLQGQVEVIRTGKARWQRVSLEETLCPGDSVRIEARSRAAILLRNETVLRLEAGTTINFEEFEPEKPSLLEIIKGAVHFISRVPRTLKIKTPYVNAAIEGTELLVRVESTESAVWVFEGQVLVSNAAGSLRLSSGQGATAEAGKAPIRRLIIRPRDAVQWALYYPSIIDFKRLKTATGPKAKVIQDAAGLYRANDLPGAIATLDTLLATDRDTQFYTLRAGMLLSAGVVDEARADIARALRFDPDDGVARALQSIIALAQNENEEAFELAKQATKLDPQSAVPQMALSYAHQAMFNIEKAKKSVERAIEIAPDDALAWARLSELELSLGSLDRALAAARKAVELDPDLERTQTVLGFARLTQIEIPEAVKAFRKAIELDSAAPLPRLGLGLAIIRQGDLGNGTREIEIAASLDPDNSLIRSYLGKAYYDQKREKLAATEYAIAKKLDPKDPTPHFYNAILKQTTNRPVEALQDMQKAIDLNNNRAVFRSRLLLDQDLAARSASLGRIFNDLSFQQLALVEGWKSVNVDPSNHSAHRLLADTYASLPRHEIARVSELLQSQLLQPININPVQPRLAESDLLILDGTGPENPSFNEFNPLFARNRLALQLSGIIGNNSTLGNEISQSGLWKKYSYSLGQFHFETDGFRENNDLERDIYNAFGQMFLSPKASLQLEARYQEAESGDLNLRFDPKNFTPSLRTKTRRRSVRGGFRFTPSINNDILGSFVLSRQHFRRTQQAPFINRELETDSDANSGELQFQHSDRKFNVIMGAGHLDLDKPETFTLMFTIDGIPNPPPQTTSFDTRHTNGYIYSGIKLFSKVTGTIGVSVDSFRNDTFSDKDQINPKLGLLWQIRPDTTFRAAAFRTLKRPFALNQTIEPTQVAGFNQFFDDLDGSEAYRYGLAVDQRFSYRVFGGFELTWRDIDKPLFRREGNAIQTKNEKQDEQFHRAYLYWTPIDRLAFSAEYQFEKFDRNLNDLLDPTFPSEITTHRVPISGGFFATNGFLAQVRANYLDQKVSFPTNSPNEGGNDQFWIVDATIGYRLPKRYGIARIGVKNMFDEEFKYQDINFQNGEPLNPRFQPERTYFAQVTFSF